MKKFRYCLSIVSILVTLALVSVAQSGTAGQQSGQRQPSSRRTAAARTGVPDKALMQKIWDGWSTLDPNNVAQYYDKSPDDVFYDITPVKYDGWDAYQKGTQGLRDMFSSAKFTVNDDARVHSSGDGALGTATIAAQLTGKRRAMPAAGRSASHTNSPVRLSNARNFGGSGGSVDSSRPATFSASPRPSPPPA